MLPGLPILIGLLCSALVPRLTDQLHTSTPQTMLNCSSSFYGTITRHSRDCASGQEQLIHLTVSRKVHWQWPPLGWWVGEWTNERSNMFRENCMSVWSGRLETESAEGNAKGRERGRGRCGGNECIYPQTRRSPPRIGEIADGTDAGLVGKWMGMWKPNREHWTTSRNNLYSLRFW